MTQVGEGQSDSCPACESDDIDKSVESFDGVCTECGLVIREESNIVALEWEITDGTLQRPKDKDWLSECRVRNATEQQLAQAFKRLEDFGKQLELSNNLREETVDIYCDAFRAEVTDGRETACVVAACLCLASRREGVTIPMSRLVEFQDVDKTKFNRSYLALCNELDIEPHMLKPNEYISYLQGRLGLSEGKRDATEQLVDSIEDTQAFVGKDPAGIAAAAVYFLEEEYTQWDVAQAVGLSTETVRRRVKELREVANDV